MTMAIFQIKINLNDDNVVKFDGHIKQGLLRNLEEAINMLHDDEQKQVRCQVLALFEDVQRDIGSNVDIGTIKKKNQQPRSRATGYARKALLK